MWQMADFFSTGSAPGEPDEEDDEELQIVGGPVSSPPKFLCNASKTERQAFAKTLEKRIRARHARLVARVRPASISEAAPRSSRRPYRFCAAT